LSPPSFLVTGGAGFIGSHVAGHLLASGARVAVWDDLNDFYDPALKRANLRALADAGGARFTFHQVDIADGPAVAAAFEDTRFEQAIHLAARAGVRPSLLQPALYQRVNVEGTVNILEGLRRAGCRKCTLASSSSVYGVNAKMPFAESDPIFNPISPYAASKLACEALGHVYHHVHGMDVVMLRFFTVYGPRQRPDLAIHKFADLITSGKPVPMFGDGSTRRDYTYVDDIVSGVLACTQKSFGYEVFNLGESQTIRLDELIAGLEAALGMKAVIDRQPAQPGDVPVTFADISKARAKLGYAPSTPVSIGLGRFVEWFRSQRPVS
jgi:UDP-glucuronate 4-epimerase